MIDSTIVTIVLDGVVLALTFSFVLLLIWHNLSKRHIALLVTLLALVVAWNLGSIITKLADQFALGSTIVSAAAVVHDAGFAASSVAFYAFASSLTGTRAAPLLRAAWLGIGAVVIARLMFSPLVLVESGQTTAQLSPLPMLLFFAYSMFGVYQLFANRRKLTSPTILSGAALFVVGQGLTFANPALGIVTISTNLCSGGLLLMTIGVIRREIIRPLAEREQQIAALHSLSKEIAGQPQLDEVLGQIALQATNWIGGDAAGVFLRDDDQLYLAATYNLPSSYRGLKMSIDNGVCGQTVRSEKAQLVENYRRDWRFEPDLPLADHAFGSFTAVPLTYQGSVAGVLFVVSGHQGRMFRSDDVFRLELLAPQAAVAIAYSALLDQQQRLLRQIEANSAQLESLLLSTENPVIAVDRRLNVLFANPAALNLLDVEQDTDVSRIRIPAQYFPPSLKALARDLQLFKVHEYEIGLDSVTYQCHVARLGKIRHEGWVAVMHDVSRLKELDRMKGEMIRMVSHDLKNPLMGAMLNVDLLRTREDAALNDSLDALDRQLDRMDRIIRGVLDLERIRTGRLQRLPHEVYPIVTKVIQDLDRTRLDKGVSITNAVDPALILEVDGDQFERALSNLVENAIKFSEQGSRVTVESEVRESDRQIAIHVKDTGIGIPAEIQSQVFDRFFRGRQRGFEHVSGSGLGLALVKAIMELHSGAVSLKSVEGQGSCFTLLFGMTESARLTSSEQSGRALGPPETRD